MKTVLYLSGHTALWVLFKKHSVVDYFEEPIAFDALIDYTPCSWFSGKYTDVHLLIDSDQSEIDAYPLIEAGAGWRNRSDKKALHNRLVEQYPCAIVRSPEKKRKLDSALVEHFNLPDQILRWLNHVERSDIAFNAIETVPELLADRLTRDRPGDACIVVSGAPEFVRHTYCVSGYALFTRAVPRTNSKECTALLNQTIDHLSASALINDVVPVYTVGLRNGDRAVLSKHKLIGKIHKIDQPIDEIGSGRQPSIEYVARLQMAEMVLQSSVSKNPQSRRQVSFGLDKHMLHTAKRQQTHRIAALAFIVLMSSIYTFANELQRARQYEQFKVRKAELSEAINLYNDEARSLSPLSAPLSKALLDRLAIESAAGVSPAIVVTVLAEAFTQYQAVELRELNWVVIDSEDQALAEEFRSQSAFSASARGAVPLLGTPPSMTIITLIGRIVSGESLREQHSVFNELVGHLEQQSGVSDVIVKRAPLSQFDGANPRTFAGAEFPEFQLQFSMARVVSNEA